MTMSTANSECAERARLAIGKSNLRGIDAHGERARGKLAQYADVSKIEEERGAFARAMVAESEHVV